MKELWECNIIKKSMSMNGRLFEKKFHIISFILSGKNRRTIFRILSERPHHASEIAQKEEISLSSVIRTLKDMIDAKVVECINPESRRRKFYQLASFAYNLKDEIESY